MPLYLYRWPDGSCSLTEARTRRAAALAFDRLGPVSSPLDIQKLPEAPAEGGGLLLHFRLGAHGALELDEEPGDRGLRPAGARKPVEGLGAATVKTLAFPLVAALDAEQAALQARQPHLSIAPRRYAAAAAQELRRVPPAQGLRVRADYADDPGEGPGAPRWSRVRLGEAYPHLVPANARR